jgi:hypothetical protein
MNNSKDNKLIPPDRKQCQSMILSGAWPDAQHFMAMGPRTSTRCTNKPVVIVYELHPGKDAQRGSMSLCGACLAECLGSFPPGYIRMEKL